jgi:hypothetical protein
MAGMMAIISTTDWMHIVTAADILAGKAYAFYSVSCACDAFVEENAERSLIKQNLA